MSDNEQLPSDPCNDDEQEEPFRTQTHVSGEGPETRERLLSLIDKLAGHRILVVGDVILDEYLSGRAKRMSREAPIPVLEFESREFIPGGAANPAANVTALGSAAIQVGLVGDDANGVALRKMLQTRHIDPAGLITEAGRPTTTKTRIMAQMGLRFPQQVARIDHVDRRLIASETEQAVITAVGALAQNVNAIMVSDYLNGLVSQSVIQAITVLGKERSILLVADSQGELHKFTNFDLVKCNFEEAVSFRPSSTPRPATDGVTEALGRMLVRKLRLRIGMVITRGPHGATLVQANRNVSHVRAPHIEDVYDTVGAGDTVLAVLTLAVAAGASYVDAVAVANLAAGIVVRKVGNYAPSPDELREAVKGSLIT